MPSQINNSGNVHNITANYLKTKPSTRFSTRQLAFVEIEVTGCQTNYANPDSLYSRAVRGVQAVAEIFAVGAPATNKFMVVIAQDTDGASDTADINAAINGNAQTMEEAVRASVQGSGDLELTIAAVYKRLSGAGFTTGVATYTDESVAGNNYAV
jgi:hypothetical protein